MRKYGKHTVVNPRGADRGSPARWCATSATTRTAFFHGADVEVLLHGQSPDIAMGVNAKNKGGNLGEQEARAIRA
jgi:S-adenosylmethionine synthetase